jgi:hypothetical protein
MAQYFKYFPTVKHNGVLLTDISRRVKLTNSILNNPYAYLPYTITAEDKPEDIAFHYYGSVNFTWLVYLSAGITDPYVDWPMTTRNFDRYFMKKYEERSGTTGQDVVVWGQDTSRTDNILYYKNTTNDTYISKDSAELSPIWDASQWAPVRYYDYEIELNENKRNINLLDRRYALQADSELKDLLK